jgi:hypothetical protein
MRWISSLSEKPVHHRLRILVARINLTGAPRVHSVVALGLRLRRRCLRESCIRENRPCSLSGGRRPARKCASSDPTPMKPPNNEVQASAEGVEGRARTKENIGQSHTPPAQDG